MGIDFVAVSWKIRRLLSQHRGLRIFRTANDRPAVEVSLRGGLGNQLFGFAAGFELGQRLALPVRLITKNYTGKDLGLRAFELAELLRPGISAESNIRNYRRYRESGFPFDRTILNLDHPVLLDGYFQSSKYFGTVAAPIRAMLRSTESFQMDTNSLPQDRFIGLQVRRGDYLQQQQRNFHGLVPYSYFVEGVRILRTILGDLPAVVFSDSRQSAVEIAGLLENSQIHVASPTSSSMEILGTLAQARGLCISNSSFGWWAAFLSQPGSPIIAPRPWFNEKSVDTRDLYEKKWLTLGY